jgi:hypothetical protein
MKSTETQCGAFTLAVGSAKWKILMGLTGRAWMDKVACRDVFERAGSRFFVGLNWDRRMREMTAAGMLEREKGSKSGQERWRVSPSAAFTIKSARKEAA